MSREGVVARNSDDETTIPYGTMAEAKDNPSKKVRGRLKYQVTISIGKLGSRLTKEENDAAAVRELWKVVEDNFNSFADYHEALHATFSPAEARVSEAYFREAKREYERVVKQTTEWLKCNEESREYEGIESDEEDEEPPTPDPRTQQSTPDGVFVGQEVLNDIISRLDTLQGQVDKVPSSRVSSTPLKTGHASLNTLLSRIHEEPSVEDGRRHEISAGDLVGVGARSKTGVSMEPQGGSRASGGSGKQEEDSAEDRILRVLGTALNSMAASFDQMASASVAHLSASKREEQTFKVPKFKLFRFSGQKIDYWPWIRAFETQVADHISDPGTLLGTLIFNVNEDTRELLQSCIVNRTPAEAYKRARELLEEQFGRKEDVAQAWLDKFYMYPEVRTSADLLKLHNSLLNCRETLTSVDQVTKFDTKTNIMMVVKKLPQELRIRWQQWAVDVEETFDHKAGLSDLIRFCKRIHKEKSDPVYGGELAVPARDKHQKNEQNSSAPYKHFRRSCNSTQQTPHLSSDAQVNHADDQGGAPRRGTRSTLKCVLCKTDHHTFRCERFRSLDPEARTKITRESGACLNCFHPEHKVAQCRSEHGCRKCNKRHHTLLHFDRGSPAVSGNGMPTFANTSPPPFQAPEGVPSQQSYFSEYGQQDVRTQSPQCGSMGVSQYSPATSRHESGETSRPPFVAHTMAGGQVALPIVPISVYGGGKMKHTYALLDSGSTCTLITNRLIEALGLEYRKVNSTINTITGSYVQIEFRVTHLDVSDMHGANHFRLNDVKGRPTLNLSLGCRAVPCDVKKWPHLTGIQLESVDVSCVEILIGQDNPLFLHRLEEIRGPQAGDPYAVRSWLGWYVGGPVQQGEHGEESLMHVNATWTGYTDQGDQLLAQKCEKFWQVDGIPKRHSKAEMSYDDERVIKMWREGVQRVGAQYMLPIPFKKFPIDVDNNYLSALQRFRSLERKLLKNESFCGKYVKSMTKNIDHFAEPVNKEKDHMLKGKIRYLPHHAVFHPRKPDEPRVVFDPSAEWNGRSLNDYIFQGPDLLNRLLHVLIVFRQDRVAILGDVEGMFNMVLVAFMMRDCLRFLWYKDHEVGGPIVEYRMKTHIFGGVWSPSCANFALKQTVLDHGAEYSEEVREMIEKFFYVDDGMKSCSTDEEAVSTGLGVRSLLSQGSFNFTKLLSNRASVQEKLPREHWAKGVTLEMLQEEKGYIHHLLGCPWLPKSDLLVYRPEIPVKEKTRRGVLSSMASLYDPLGLVSPVILQAKMIFQDSTRRKQGWDQQVEPDLLEQWNTWLSNVSDLEEVSFARCLLPGDMSLKEPGLTFELHHFSDAAKRAYGANSYLRVLRFELPISAALILSKGRLAPMKQLTIPRLELQGAHSAVELDCLLRDALSIPISRSIFWIDSTIVLCYVYDTGARHPTFEANRLGYIWENTASRQWRHVPTHLNPADIVSRGCSPRELQGNLLWSQGPMFLLQTEENWPEIPTNAIKKEKEVINSINAVLLAAEDEELAEKARRSRVHETASSRLIERFDSWYRLKKSVAYWTKFWEWRVVNKKTKRPDPITVKKLNEIGENILRYVQKTRLVDVESCKKKQYQQLYPVEVNGLIRVGSRLKKSNLHHHAKFPVVVPEGHVARLLAREAHAATVHGGRRRTLEEVRKRYWLIRGGKVVRCVVSKCVPCRRARAPLCRPVMQDLPRARVEGEQPAFTATGLDYFGPMMVKSGRTERKRYGCLFTCLQTRAVHIELAYSLDMDACISAITRFAARRRWPSILWSDNGTNFVAARRILEEAIQGWNLHHLEVRLQQKGCDWRFNTPAASHQGGVWERMIRVARELLMRLVNGKDLTDDSLTTLFCLVEDVINNRPITSTSDDPADLTALTPNHLLKPEAPVILPPGIFEKRDTYRQRWKIAQYLTDVFWERWTREYLPSLHLRPKWYKQEKNLSVGDLVTVLDESLPRNLWPLARVEEIFPGPDGVVRNVAVRTARGVIRRPVQKLCLLEAAVP